MRMGENSQIQCHVESLSVVLLMHIWSNIFLQSALPIPQIEGRQASHVQGH